MKLLLPTLLFCISSSLTAQNYLMNNTSVTDCSGSFFDSGGGTGNYGNNETFTKTFCSDGVTGTHIQLNFSGVDLAAGDALCFYDGPNTAANLLACSDDYPPGSPIIVQATAANPSGCLTVQFESDGSGTATGWSAVISCVASCQTVLANLVTTTPAAFPADTGWIDVCPNERIFFNGTGSYPQNGFAYQQSDLTTTFEWNFGDGGISYGPNTSHRFDEPGGYYVQLFLVDAQGCKSTNLINQRIRVAPRPNFALAGVVTDQICARDTIHLSAAVADTAGGQTLVVTPNPSSFSVEGSRSDSLALPDGTGIPYETTIFFTEFSPGQVMTSENDLESICVNMEHSWMRDIEISLTCPNGQSIVLHNFAGQTGGGVNLGEPNDADVFIPVPGLGYDYCWIPNAPRPTWIQYANTTLGGGGTLPSGDYSTFDPISDLIGCPLNGEWSITVTDLWPIDNGFIFNWSLKFQDELYPNIETFTPAIVDWSWNNHPSIFYATQDSISAAPQNAGTAGYIFTVRDTFGCSWDTLVNVSILPFTHPNCFSCQSDYEQLRDTAVCDGEPVELDASSLLPPTLEVQFESYPGYKIGNGNHPHNNPYPAPISVNSVGFNLLTNPIAQITEVCMEIETDFDADLNIYLRSPDGKQLELSTGNGGAGDNYKITCFSPTAVTPIVGSSAPFNGTYRPEGLWTALNNSVVNGDWKLMVSDGFGTNQLGNLKWWSIGFNYDNSVSYSWTNSATLDCNNCATPVATPAAGSTYIVTATDRFNCVHKDTVTLSIMSFFPAPANLEVIGLGANDMTWAWQPVQGATGYEVSINAGPWQAASGSLTHTVTGLVSGDMVNIEVRALGGSPNCPPNIASAANPFVMCTLTGSIASLAAARCAGTNTGSAIINANNANGSVDFFANGTGTAFPTGDLVNMFGAGGHFVVLRDAAGCRDTVDFSITEPATIVLTPSKSDVLCNGGSSGSAFVNAVGGTGNVSFVWQLCAGGTPMPGSAVNNLFAGCYAVVATDDNGCTATATVQVAEPDAYAFQLSQDSVSCRGLSDGAAHIQVSGGTFPYQYDWDNSANTPDATGFSAGLHFVTVTDAANCISTTSIEVFEPSQLVIDSVASRSVSCFGGNNGTASVFPLGGTSPYNYLWIDNQDTPKALNLSANTYAVTVSDANGCSTAASVTVASPDELQITFINVAGEKCAEDCKGTATVQVDGGTAPYAYQWADANLPDSALVENLCPGQYILTVEDDRGCTLTDKVDINAAIPIDIHFDLADPSCAGFQDGTIETTVSGGSQPYQYVWSSGTTSTADLLNLTCGQYVLTLTDAAGCIRTDTTSLECPLSIEVSSISTKDVNCFGGADGVITVQAQGGNGTLHYQWNDPNAQTNAIANNLAIGNYTVTVTDDNGCNITASAVVAQPNILLASASKTDVTCFNGSDGSATANPVGGVGPYSFEWDVSQTEQVAVDLPAGMYLVTVTDNHGCTVTTSATLQQPATAVQVSTTQTQTACYDQSNGVALASASGGNGAPFTFNWSNNQNTPAANNLPVGNYTVTASDSKGCTSVQNINIQQFDSISANVIFVEPTCNGYLDGRAAVNLVHGGAGGSIIANYIYQWSKPNAPNSVSIDGLQGDKTYTLTVTDQQGCSGVFAFTVNQPPAIVVTTAHEDVSCFGFSDGSARVENVQGDNPVSSYSWSNNFTGVQINNVPIGAYTVTVVDSQGCTGSSSLTVTQPERLSVEFVTKPLLCSADANAEIAALVDGGTPQYNLQWSNGNAVSSITNLGPGVYTLQITDLNGCILTDSASIIRPDDLVVDVRTTDPRCFEAQNGHIDLSVTGGKLPYRYNIDGGEFGGSPNFIGLGAGVYSIQVRDANNCITTLTDSLDQPLQLSVSLGMDSSLILGDSLMLLPDVSNAVGTLIYKWQSALLDTWDCLDTIDCESILVKPDHTNTYFLQITDANGCNAESRVKISVEKPRGVYVPTAFSPNGDQSNDLLMVHGKSAQVRNIRVFQVYDRWGELVYQDQNFSVNDATRGWDGHFHGGVCDPGVFVWHLEAEYVDGFREVLSGSVTLVK
ncbi:MAG: proprotein convertase P-domain-containing protein [Saprospiraceae bacterium]|nr:proprotein convertase P-domain-containing protein [Saprospiraceae bacterium]